MKKLGTVGNVLRWLFGIIFLIGGLSIAGTESMLEGIFLALFGFSLLPFFWKLISHRKKYPKTHFICAEFRKPCHCINKKKINTYDNHFIYRWSKTRLLTQTYAEQVQSECFCQCCYYVKSLVYPHHSISPQ